MMALGQFSTVATMSCTLLLISGLASGIQFSVGIEHDMTKPTFGIHGQSSSTITYGDKSGLKLTGNANDIFGPPLKIANGFHNMLTGGNKAGIGSSLKSGGALLGLDAKWLEAEGGADLLAGGMLMGGLKAKESAAGLVGKNQGKQIGSIIEVPVKVVAMKELETGKMLVNEGKNKEAQALAAKTKGSAMYKDGQALKSQGMSQVMQGAAEGFQNLGHFAQQTTGNVATLFKLLPLMLDLPIGQPPAQQQQQVEQHATTKTATNYGSHGAHQQMRQASGVTGGSVFGGLGSLLPGMSPGGETLLGNLGNLGNSGPNHHTGLFGLPTSGASAGHTNDRYAAVLNTTNPLHNILMNPGLSPLIYPLTQGPLSQAMADKQPASGSPLALLFGGGAPATPSSGYAASPVKSAESHQQQQQQQQHYQQQQQQPHVLTQHRNFNLFPGLKISETSEHTDYLHQSPLGSNAGLLQQQQQAQSGQKTSA